MEKRAFSKISFGIFFVGVLWCGASLLMNIFSEGIRKLIEKAGAPGQIIGLFVNLFMYGASILILSLFLKGLPTLEGEPKHRLGFRAFLGYFCSMRGVATMLSIVGFLVSLIVILLVRGPENLAELLFKSNPLPFDDSSSVAVELILICVAAPLLEELMFRRLLMDALRPFGDVVAILYSGIAFGLLHMNFQQLFYAAGVGLIFGYVMVKTNNIWYCIGLHAALNTTSAIILPFMDGVDLNNPDLQSASFIAVGFFVGVLLVISVTGIVLFFANIKKIRVEGPRFRFSVPVGGKQALINAGTIPYILICIAISVYRITIL